MARPYSQKADLTSKFSEKRLRELTDDENDGSKVDERIDDAIRRADNEIDSHLRGRYAVPLDLSADEDLEFVRDISTDIAIYELYRRRGDFLLRSDKTQGRYKEAIGKLKQIKAGEITFAGDGSPNVPRTSRRNPRVYTTERLSQY